jgi:hypothetical protein
MTVRWSAWTPCSSASCSTADRPPLAPCPPAACARAVRRARSSGAPGRDESRSTAPCRRRRCTTHRGEAGGRLRGTRAVGPVARPQEKIAAHRRVRSEAVTVRFLVARPSLRRCPARRWDRSTCAEATWRCTSYGSCDRRATSNNIMHNQSEHHRFLGYATRHPAKLTCFSFSPVSYSPRQIVQCASSVGSNPVVYAFSGSASICSFFAPRSGRTRP